MAVWSIVRFKTLPEYKIEVSFADGTTGIADLGPRLSRGALGDGWYGQWTSPSKFKPLRSALFGYYQLHVSP